MYHLRRSMLVGAACVCLVGGVRRSRRAERQRPRKDGRNRQDAKRPQIRLKANPVISVSPAQVMLVAEIVGGANDFEEFYCPTVEWDWGDGTHSESSSDCAPYRSGQERDQTPLYCRARLPPARQLSRHLPAETTRQSRRLRQRPDPGPARVAGRSVTNALVPQADRSRGNTRDLARFPARTRPLAPGTRGTEFASCGPRDPSQTTDASPRRSGHSGHGADLGRPDSTERRALLSPHPAGLAADERRRDD